jgi:D-galactarolactone cycloisomerase
MTSGAGLAARLDHASPVRSGRYQQTTLVRVTTDQGIVGWGECHAPAAPAAHRTVITDLLGPVVIGQDARNVEALWERMYSTQRLRGYATGFFMEAIAGVDIALWDALGKYADLPVYQLLGGRYRNSIPTYTGVGGATVDELAESARRAIDAGFPAVKLGLSKGHGTRDLDRVAAASEAVQQKGQVLVDSLGGYKVSEALAVGRRLDAMGNIGWWEDPLMPEDVDGYAALTSRLDLPICLGEEISNRFQFRDMASRGAMNITNPDVCRSGGITESRPLTIREVDRRHRDRRARLPGEGVGPAGAELHLGALRRCSSE